MGQRLRYGGCAGNSRESSPTARIKGAPAGVPPWTPWAGPARSRGWEVALTRWKGLATPEADERPERKMAGAAGIEPATYGFDTPTRETGYGRQGVRSRDSVRIPTGRRGCWKDASASRQDWRVRLFHAIRRGGVRGQVEGRHRIEKRGPGGWDGCIRRQVACGRPPALRQVFRPDR